MEPINSSRLKWMAKWLWCLFGVSLLAIAGCAGTDVSGRGPAAAHNAGPEPVPYAQYVAHIRPLERSRLEKPPFLVEGPVAGEREVVPSPVDEAAYTKKLRALLSPGSQGSFGDKESTLVLKESDYVRGIRESSAIFTVVLNENERIKVSLPWIGDQLPGIDEKGIYPGDASSKGERLVGHSLLEVAWALAELPPTTRKLIKRIDLLSKRSPYDEIYTKLYGRPADQPMRAYMQALPEPLGTIVIAPQPESAQPEPALISSTLAHEIGHVWSFKCFGMVSSSKAWTDWRNAMARDADTVSAYARSSFLEDSAEMALLYSAVLSWADTSKGEELESTLKGRFPSRWRILEATFPLCGLR